MDAIERPSLEFTQGSGAEGRNLRNHDRRCLFAHVHPLVS